MAITCGSVNSGSSTAAINVRRSTSSGLACLATMSVRCFFACRWRWRRVMFVLFFIVSLALIEARTKHVVNCYTEGLYCLMMATHLLDIQKLTKQYAGTNYLAIHSVTLQVDPGEVYGFLGANGAGKSTTIRTLLNFIQPSSGTATIRGHDIVKEAVA